MAATTTPYAYLPLGEQEIRLMHLFPGARAQPLCCEIEHVAFPVLTYSFPETPDANAESHLTTSSSRAMERTSSKLVDSQHGVEESRQGNNAGKTGSETQPDYVNLSSGLRRDLPSSEMIHDDHTECDMPQYEALSYVWGPQDNPCDLYIVGGKKKVLRIGPNLHNALQFLRPSSGVRPRNLWIDQVCIDQQNLLERSRQVVKMGSIFKEATKVLIWLGLEDRTTTLTFDFARKVGEIPGMRPNEEQAVQLGQYFIHQIPAELMAYHHCLYGHDSDYEAAYEWCMTFIRKISYRPWFERAWVYQEVKLARTSDIICGSQQLPWKIFEGILSQSTYLSFYRHPTAEFEPLKYLKWSKASRVFGSVFYGGSLNFRDLLQFRASSVCMDARDKVISLLAIADKMAGDKGHGPWHASKFIKPDYHASVEELYIRAAYYLINDCKNLSLLTAAKHRGLYKLPSWVPDWTAIPKDETSLKLCCNWYPQATRNSFFPAESSVIDVGGSNLQVQVIRHGVITSLNTYDDNFDPEFFTPAFRDGIYHSTMQPGNIAAKQTMMREQWANTSVAARAKFFGLNAHVSDGEVKEELNILIEYSKRDPKVQAYRNSEGLIGLASQAARPNDEICLLLGYDLPVVLRRMDNGYRFLGPCYAHGLMYGEGLHPSRTPRPCMYPCSKSIDTREIDDEDNNNSSNGDDYVWPLQWDERLDQDRRAQRAPQWFLMSRSVAEDFFNQASPYLKRQRYIVSRDWKASRVPPQQTGDEPQQWVWLLEKGFDPTPIITETIDLV